MKLKKQREKLNLTQSDVAKSVGVSLTSYQLWEREVSTPNDKNMKKLMKVLSLNEEE